MGCIRKGVIHAELQVHNPEQKRQLLMALQTGTLMLINEWSMQHTLGS
jgi:hypothetical protein